ncbi:MAG TPA: hypothetical protein VMB26_05675 [Candidatus Binataceae bacterium]|nr:hypothetical protein [Candidatus Binataceae bacterium]
MAVTVKKAVLWRKEVENRPGELADTLEPLVAAGADLKVVMGYRYGPGQSMAAIELYPITGRKAVAAAEQSGLSASPIPSLLVEGDDKPGLGHAIAGALGDANINLTFVVAQVVGRRYSAIFGFENEADASQAAKLIKKAAPARKSR